MLFHNKSVAQSGGIITRRDLIIYIILSCIPIFNIITIVAYSSLIFRYFKIKQKISNFLDEEL